MEESKSKPFFRNLKETVSVINKVVSETIEASTKCPGEYNYSEFNEYYEKKLNDIKQTKDELVKLKKEFDYRLTYFQNYFHDFQDLVLEVEENVNSQEKYLQKYGYKPLEVVSIIESPVSKTPPLEEKHNDKSKTPSIYDYIDLGQINLMRQTNSGDKIEETINTIHELESGDGTPVLMLNKNSTKCEDLKNVLSAVDEKECAAKAVEKLPPSTPPFGGYLESSVVVGDSVCDTPYSDVSLNKIARKLNF